MNQYNYLIVGSGLFGTTMAYLLQKGYKVMTLAVMSIRSP